MNEWANGIPTFSDVEKRVQIKAVDTLRVPDLKNFIKSMGGGSRGNYHKDELVKEVYDIFAKRALGATNVKVEPYSPNTISPQNPPSNSTLSEAKPSPFVMKFEPENGSSSSDSKENIAMKPEKSEKFSMETGNDTDNISPAASSHLPLSNILISRNFCNIF